MANKSGSKRDTPKTLPERRDYFQTIKSSPSGDTIEPDISIPATDHTEPIVPGKKQVKAAPRTRRRKKPIIVKLARHIKKHYITYIIYAILAGVGTLFLYYAQLNREVGELSVSVKKNDEGVKRLDSDISKIRDFIMGAIGKKK
jgi:hypothetical protein